MNKFILCLAVSISSSIYAAGGGLYTPQAALADMASGKLVFIGRDLFPGSDQNRTCVYKSDTAFILYNNCLSSKKEGAVLDVEVISFKGGITRFYVESDKPVSTLQRSDYSDPDWSLDYMPSPATGPLTITELKKYKSLAQSQSDSESKRCFTSNGKARCTALPESENWILETEKFWKEPGEDWYKIQKVLRKAITDSRF